MFIKLVNPVNGAIHVFQIGPEFRAERDTYTVAELDTRQTELDEPVKLDGRLLPVDNRRFMAHRPNETPDMTYRMLLIDVPACHWDDKTEQLVVFTNWHAYLMSDTGQTIDRLFVNDEVGPP